MPPLSWSRMTGIMPMSTQEAAEDVDTHESSTGEFGISSMPGVRS